MEKIFLVAAGGMIGAVCRYLVTYLSLEKLGVGFPYGTLIVNIVGCLLAGAVMGAISEKLLLNENMRLLLVVGFAGGLTTFSSFSFDTINLLQQGQAYLAVVNVFANMFLGFLATILGIHVVRLF